MPNRKRSDVRAGLFILAAVAVTFAGIVAIKGVRTVFATDAVRQARFGLDDDLGGLRIGDEVRVGGFKVGNVRTIDLINLDHADDKPPYIRVRFSMPERYPLAADAHLFVQSSITGTTVLNIDSLGKGTPLTADDELVGHPSSFNALLAQVSDVAPEVRQMIATIRTSTLPKIDAAADKLPDTLASFKVTAEHTTVAVDTAGSVFGDTKPDIRGTMANLHSLTDTAKARLPALLDRATTLVDQATGTIADARTAVADIRATAANARELSASARDVVVDNRSKFDTTIAGLKATGDNLKEATAEIRRNPWRLLYQPKEGEMNNLALYDAARQFADGANHVDDAALALKDALRNPSTDAAQVRQLVGRLDETVGHFRAVERKLWSAVQP